MRALWWVFDTILYSIERVRRGVLCLRHGHDFRPAARSGRKCTRCPTWED